MSDDYDDEEEDYDEQVVVEVKEEAKKPLKKKLVVAKALGGAGADAFAKLKEQGAQAESMKQQAFKRMEKGIHDILALHTPYELSSICGQMGLKQQQKPDVSMRQIIEVTCPKGKMTEETAMKLLTHVWEGALWEYLRAIGHPFHNQFLDPKKTLIRIWEEGGLIANGRSFIPHFIAREVQKRYNHVRSDDLTEKLEILREKQENAKKAERNIIANHDYNNILAYFQQMGELRNIENSTRDYLVGEIERERNKIRSQENVANIVANQMKELEFQLLNITEYLNERLAQTEAVCEYNTKKALNFEAQVGKITEVLRVYSEAEKNRETPGLGLEIGVYELNNRDKCYRATGILYDKLKEYKEERDNYDDTLRSRCRDHVTEIRRLEEYIRRMEHQLKKEYDRANYEQARAESAERDARFAALKMTQMKMFGNAVHQQTYGSWFRYASMWNEHERRRKACEPLILGALLNSKPDVKSFAQTLISVGHLVPEERVKETYEWKAMLYADNLSLRMRILERKMAKNKKNAMKSLAKDVVKKDKDDDKMPGSKPGTAEVKDKKRAEASDGADAGADSDTTTGTKKGKKKGKKGKDGNESSIAEGGDDGSVGPKGGKKGDKKGKKAEDSDAESAKSPKKDKAGADKKDKKDKGAGGGKDDDSNAGKASPPKKAASKKK